MSLMSVILAFAPSLAARFQPKEDTPVDDKSHPRFIAGYEAGLEDGRRSFDVARNRLFALEVELERVRRQRDAAREELCRRLMDRPLPAQVLMNPVQPPQRPPSQAELERQAERARAMQMQAQMMPNPLGAAGLLGVQAYPDGWASCTPSRSRAMMGAFRIEGDCLVTEHGVIGPITS